MDGGSYLVDNSSWFLLPEMEPLKYYCLRGCGQQIEVWTEMGDSEDVIYLCTRCLDCGITKARVECNA